MVNLESNASPQEALATLTHEVAHIASSLFIDGNPNHPLVKKLNKLMTEARDLFNELPFQEQEALDLPDGTLDDVSEFYSEGFGNPSFMRKLAERKSGEARTLMSRFLQLVKSIIRNILGKPLVKNSIL